MVNGELGWAAGTLGRWDTPILLPVMMMVQSKKETPLI
jgi:hypothetical protein